jgi:hypothetical protein
VAEKTTVAGAQAKAGYLVPVPSTAAASRASLTQAWVNGNTIPRKKRQVALLFDNGKVEILMHRATYQSALHYFHAFIAEKNQNGGVTAEIGQVNGRPALVVTPGTNYSHSNPAVVNFWRNGVLISIYSPHLRDGHPAGHCQQHAVTRLVTGRVAGISPPGHRGPVRAATAEILDSCACAKRRRG